MTYQDALAYIHSTCWKGSRPGLSRTRELTDRLGRPQDGLKFIHIAGTNGKGSTSAMLASILQKAGYRVGLYTSPYILRFNERMKIDGQDIPDDELAEITEAVKPHAEAMEDSPTEFELITAIALCYFARHNCDVVVFEVGMGGRLDSTNIIDGETVVASVITGIAMDHTAFLGDTPEKIAAEKAGIIKAGVPVLYGGHHPAVGEALPSPEAISCGQVIREKAAEMNAPYRETDHTLLSNIRADLFGCDFDFGEHRDLHIPLAGLYQPHNAANVLTALDVIRGRGFVVSEEAVREGLAAVYWPGRFEILSRSPLIIADGGHNPEGIDAAIASVKEYFKNEKILLLTGVMADKDYAHMVARMGEVTARAFCVRPANDRALDAAKYAESFRAIGIPAEGYATVAEGVAAASAVALAEGKALLCLGSLYMYGEVRAAVLGE
jgi:dihydrofolate synthase/folylpolyglutamate synthase